MATESQPSQPVTTEAAIKALTGAAQDAVDSDDYITYSTLLDIYLEDPERYSESDRVKILQALEDILRKNETLLSYVAWDLPVLLLPYLASDDPFDQVAAAKHPTPRKSTLRLFNLIAEKGNAKELFLKAIEALSTLTVDFSPDATPEKNLDSEKLFVLKFYALFEVIISVTRRITTQYPSRFLTASSTALLSFFSSHVDELSDQSLPVLLRRLYLFSRDYVPPPSKSPVDSEEEALQRRMLQSYVTHMVEIMLRNRSVDWSRRYFAAIKPGLEVIPVKERERPVTFEGAVSASITEMLERFMQLTLSYDIEPVEFQATILQEPPELEPENEDEIDPSFPAAPTSNESIPYSAEGCLLLLAEHLISEPSMKINFTFPEIIQITKRFVLREEGGTPGAAVCDAIGFFGWRFLRQVTREQIEAVSTEDFNGYLQVLTSLSATSPHPPVRYLFHTLVVHLLSRAEPERAYGYIIDTLQFCPFENVRGAFVLVLKEFLYVPSNTEKPTSDDKVVYDEAKREQVEELIQTCVSDIENSPGLLLDEKFPTLLAWVNNFLPIIGGSKSLLEDILPRLKKLIEQDKAAAKKDSDVDETDERTVRAGILSSGLELLTSGELGISDKLSALAVSDSEKTPVPTGTTTPTGGK
ncbi:YAP-binding/ALF4/Glomulin [Myxozyma melibiosi]|uniref:YAP-binding/ALF4/Glomulin n=1 Tax=Myxozyma melibiosi TaxID=54550 RepID=A0ABR1FFN8_9ASCO